MRLFFYLCATLFAISSVGFSASANGELNKSLIYYSYFGKADAVQRLLDQGADPNTLDEHGWPVIAVATDRTDGQALEISKALIKAGAEVNRAKGRNYAIVNAIKNRNVDLVAQLIYADANLRVKAPDGSNLMTFAKKKGNQEILEIVTKRVLEQRQFFEFLQSKMHIKQLTSQYGFHHCAFQYWGYYLRSKQDKNIDEEKIKDHMRYHANEATKIGRRALQFFPDVYNKQYDLIAGKQRKELTENLNKLISNRNRRIKGVGKTADMFKRCQLNKTPTYFHNIAAPYSQ